MKIKKLEKSDMDEALKLVMNVFMMFEAPDYIDEGIVSFRKCINSREYIDNLAIYGAFDDDNVIGVIATRNEGNHIALFFVHGKYHRQGIGKRLFETVIDNSTENMITVNSSPYAAEVYHHLGFIDTDTEQLVDGMRFIPMIYRK
ncbi:MAG: GNAT family N-acetyltransferase [Clostridia bacterium]|nr:GNAT family N-acetyltransferase [Clostridia bacterium]